MEAVANRKPVLADAEQQDSAQYLCDRSETPVWRDGLCQRYTFIAVKRESDEYRVMVVAPQSDGRFKVKSYGPFEGFVPESDPDFDLLSDEFRKGSGPYLRRWFSEGQFKLLLAALARNPELEVVTGDYDQILSDIRQRKGNTSDLEWHPDGNGAPDPFSLYEVQETRRRSG